MSLTQGVSAVPNARISTPLNKYGRRAKAIGDRAPATGATAPHINCPTAIAKLIVTMPNTGRTADGKNE